MAGKLYSTHEQLAQNEIYGGDPLVQFAEYMKPNAETNSGKALNCV